MYSRVGTINVSTADGYIFSSKETFIFLVSNVIYPLVNIKFPPTECADELF